MNKTIRDEVYFISSSLNLGGAEVQSVWLANQFQKKGYKVSYVVLKNTTFIASYLNEDVELIQYKMYTENSRGVFRVGCYWSHMVILFT